MTMLEWARFYAGKWGASVVPLGQGKVPSVPWGRYRQERPSDETLVQWFGEGKAWGMALVCGSVSRNLVRFDFDDPADYDKLFMDMPKAPTFKSQRKGGGYGMVMTCAEPVPKLPEGTLKGFPRLGVQGEGSITVVPPTPGYEWTEPPPDGLPQAHVHSLLKDLFGFDLFRHIEGRGDKGEGPDDELHELLDDTAEGGRDDAIVRITNILRARGLGVEAIKDVLRPKFEEWPGAGTTMTWEEAEAKVESSFRQYEHQGTRFGKKEEKAEDSTFEDAEGGLFDKVKSDEEAFLVKGLVMGGDQANVAMAAYAGTGKTTMCLGVAICMAQGRPVLGVLEVARPLRVVYIDEEGVASQIRETARKISAVYGRPDDASMLTLLGGKFDSYRISNRESLDKLEARLDRIRPDFVFLDGWQWFVDHKISDRDVVGPALKWWKRIRLKYGCGTWIIHHTKKIGAPQFRPANPLELSSGAQTLMDQARTKLVFEHMVGDFVDYGLLQGRCGRGEWNPIRMVLEYDTGTQSHRMVGRDEAADVFDAETVKEIWGEPAATHEVRSILNALKRRGCGNQQLADFFGINVRQIFKWKAGATSPAADKLEALRGLLTEAERKDAHVDLKPDTRVQGHIPGHKQVTFAPAEAEKMPIPIKKDRINKGVTCPESDESNDASLLSESSRLSDAKQRPIKGTAGKDKKPAQKKESRIEGKPGPLCGKCPYREQAFVGGRGGRSGGPMLVGDGPGEADAKSGRSFSGRTALGLERHLRDAKIDPNLCRYTNAVACHVPKTRKPTKKAMECCRPLLEAELAEFKPKTIITLGEEAFSAFYPGKLKTYHGTRIKGEGYTLVPMYKLDASDKTPSLLRTISNDFHFLPGKALVRRLEGDYRRASEFKPSSETAAIDTETTGLERDARIVGVGISEAPGEAVFLSGEAGIEALRKHMPDRVVMHNAKFDLAKFEMNGLAMERFPEPEDTMILAYVMCRENLGLKDLAVQELGLEMQRFEDVIAGKATFEDVPEEEQVQYGCSDPDGTLRLWNDLWKKASSKERRVYSQLDRPLVPVLAQMEVNGIWADAEYLKQLGREVDEEMDQVAAHLEHVFGLEREALTKPKEMQDYIYRKLKLPISALTDPDNPSTGRRILERLRSEHDAVNLILRYRELSALKNSFVTGILERIRDGKVFPNFNQARVVTGRLSTSNPNFQGIPSRRTSEFRRAIVAPPGHVVVALDNSQIDIRSLAHISQCPVLNKLYEDDEDIHAITSMLIYGDLEGTHRFEAKAANFMPVFGGTYIGLARRTGMSEEKAQEFLDKWYKHYYGVPIWIRKLRKDVLETGYVETVYGRRRHIPGVFGRGREHAFRQAQNTPIQGTSADVLKLQTMATAEVVMPFAQIHDELDFYVPEKQSIEAAMELKKAMLGIDCPFKLKVDVKIGPNLGDVKKLED